MATLISTATGMPEEVPNGQVFSLLSGGGYNVPPEFLENGQLVMVSPYDGKRQPVPDENLVDFFKQNWTLPSLQELAAEREAEENAGFDKALEAAALGGLKGVSSNLALPIVEAVGPEGSADWLRGKYQAAEKHHPGAMALGEGAGTVLGLAGGPVKMAATGASKVGLKVAASQLAQSGGKLGKLLGSKAGQYAVEGAIDSAIYAGTDELHQQVLAEKELSGQLMLTEAAKGGAGGAVLGGVLGAGAQAVGATWRKAVKPVVTRTLRELSPVTLPDDFSSLEDLARGIGKEAVTDQLGMSLKHVRSIAARDKREAGWLDRWKNYLFDTVDDAGEPLVKGDWDVLTEKAEAEVGRVGGQLQDYYQRIDDLQAAGGGGVNFRRILEGIEDLKKNLPQAASGAEKDGLNRAVDTLKRSVIENDIVRSIDTGDVNDMRKRLAALGIEPDIDEDVAALLMERKDALFDASTKDISLMYDALEPNARGLKVVSANQEKGVYQAGAKYDASVRNEARKLSAQIGRIWRQEIDDTAESLLKGIDDADFDFAGFKDVKERMGFSTTLQEIVSDRAARDKTNLRRSLGDNLWGLGGAAVATATGAGPLATAGLAYGGAALSRALRVEGSSFTASGAKFVEMAAKDWERGLGRMRKLFEGTWGTAKKSTKLVRRATIAMNAKEIYAMAEKTDGRKKPKTKQEAMGYVINDITRTAANPAEFAGKLQKDLQELEIVAPEVAAEIAATEMRKMEYLNGKAPKMPAPYNKLQPQLYENAYLTRDAMAEFEQCLMASTQPVDTFFGELERGILTSETCEAIEYVYPNLYAKLQETILDITSQSATPKSERMTNQHSHHVQAANRRVPNH